MHKAQGLSLQHAIVDCGKDIFSTAQVYVALSRVVSSDNLILLNFDREKVSAFMAAKVEYNRLRKMIGLDPFPLYDTRARKRKSAAPIQNYVSKGRHRR